MKRTKKHATKTFTSGRFVKNKEKRVEADDVTLREVSKVAIYQAKKLKEEEFSRLMTSLSDLPSGEEDGGDTDTSLSSINESIDSELQKEIDNCGIQIAEIIPELEGIYEENEQLEEPESEVFRTCEQSKTESISNQCKIDSVSLKIRLFEERVSALETENLELMAKNSELEFFKNTYEKELSDKLDTTQRTLSDLMSEIETFTADKLNCEDFALLENLPEATDEKDESRQGFRSSVPRKTTNNKMLNIFNLIAENVFANKG